MPALLKFLVPLAIFLSGSYAHAFTSLSPVAGNQARVNHLIRFEESMRGWGRKTAYIKLVPYYARARAPSFFPERKSVLKLLFDSP